MEDSKVKRYRPYIVIFIAVLVMEIFVFNWRYIEGMGYEEKLLEAFTCGTGVTYTGTNEIRVENNGDKYIEFGNVNVHSDNIYIDIINKRCNLPVNMENGNARDFQRVPVVIGMTDEANSELKDMPERMIAQGVERTKYIKLHTAGETGKIRIRFNGCENQTLLLKEISVNKQVPFSINLLRMIFLYAVALVGYMFRKGSPLYEVKYDRKSYGQLWAVILLISANIVVSGIFCFSNPMFIEPSLEHHHQYDNLAQAFINGHVYLDYAEPSQALINMENPYDKGARDKVMSESHSSYKWDHAYYDGKYYVYFGALPVLLYYMPHRLMTGEEFGTHTGVFLNLVFYTFFAFLLVRALVRKYFKDIPFVNYIMISQVLVASGGIIFAMRKPDLYAMPISMALGLTMAGLYFWVTALDCRTKVMRCVKLAAGSLFMALVSGCRPQFLIASFLAIPLFAGDVLKKKTLFSKTSVAESVAFVLPYIPVAAVVMWYNYARFGSVFDFGANYNLTTNDMTRRGFNIGRLPFGLFAYFIQLPVTYARFPFITGTNLSNNYMGTTICEMMCGGILITQPLLWLLALTGSLKEQLKKKGIFGLIVCSVIFSLVVAVADTEMAGILYRYYMDYSYLMLIPAALIAFTLCEKGERKINYAVNLLCIGCMCYNFALLFLQGDFFIDYTNPNLYYAVTSALTFWM